MFTSPGATLRQWVARLRERVAPAGNPRRPAAPPPQCGVEPLPADAGTGPLDPALADKLIAQQAHLYQGTQLALLRDTRGGQRRCAVFLPYGAGSIHDTWFSVAEERSWDLIAYCYDGSGGETVAADTVFGRAGDFNGTKFTAFARLMQDYPGLVWHYDYWMLMDNDIVATVADVDRIFRIMKERGIDLAQPSLSDDSPCAWPVMRHREGAAVRYVNAAEIMTFAFSRRALRAGRHLFRESVSGFGIDLALGQVVRDQLASRPAVIDAVTVTHAKEIDQDSGKFYAMLERSGINPWHELRLLQSRYGFEVSFAEAGE